jgi:transcriptional regulator with XRE-family HTH domain
MSTFSERLRYLRTEANLSQKELAEALGMSFSTISDYERGYKTDPYMSTLVKLAKHFNVSIDYMAGQSEERFTNAEQRLKHDVDSMPKHLREMLFGYLAQKGERDKN